MVNKQTKFAVVKINNNQYKVSEGQDLDVLQLEGKEGDKINFDEVLLKVDGEKIEVGTPFVAGASIQAQISAYKKGLKVKSSTYKAKARIRRRVGNREKLTTLKIIKIS